MKSALLFLSHAIKRSAAALHKLSVGALVNNSVERMRLVLKMTSEILPLSGKRAHDQYLITIYRHYLLVGGSFFLFLPFTSKTLYVMIVQVAMNHDVLYGTC